MPNRLAHASSPYLLQHQDNPVDWWPWGPEAFAEAKRTGKPVFVSIGYAACHWCHVMAHESFEDAATAAVMNELFVNIKIDREEHPEVDAIYMNAIMVQGEGGGWPLSAFCLPDGRPYFMGTYFPKTAKYGRKGFTEVLRVMEGAYREQREAVLENVESVMEGLGKLDEHYRRAGKGVGIAALGAQTIIRAGQQLAERCDPVHGGMQGAPKFPSSATHAVLGHAARLGFGDKARRAFLGWARGMAEGGIYDHVGGGFARYAVDDKWLVPHFEKMLYDQAQLLAIYADVVTLVADDPADRPLRDRAERVITETVGFLERELSDPAGGLWSSLDADSEGEEGKYYVWTPDQVKAAVGMVKALELCRAFGVSPGGNFEHGTSVLSRVTPAGSAYEEESLREGLAALRAARDRRVRPGTDDKVLAGWNGLAISGLVRAWSATGHGAALALATRAAQFLRDRMLDGGTLRRVYKTATGVAPSEGTLDDYAFCAVAFLDLAETTGDAAWWRLARGLVDRIQARFVDEGAAGVVFYLAPGGDPLLIHRPESHHDGAIPSGAGAAIEALLRIAHAEDDARYLALVERYLGERLGEGGAAAWTTSRLLCCLDRYLHGQQLVVSEGPGRDELVIAARRAGGPTLALAGAWTAPALVEGKPMGADGRARAYLCRGTTCSPPVATPEELTALLRGRGA